MIGTTSDIPVYVVIVAGGQGTRMGMALPKQFLPLAGKPILYHTIAAFARALPQAHLVLVLPEDDISKLQMILSHFSDRIDLTVVAGGTSRFESVKRGLAQVGETSLVLVHDGVRPFVSDALIQRCLRSAAEYGSAIPAIPMTDSVRIAGADDSFTPIDRAKLRVIQTPQAFRSEWILEAFRQDYRIEFTDEATVVESLNHPIRLVEGEKTNIKITTPEDLILAENIILRKNS
ncbi:MAG: 2-C-methyl-D-erythritol 4-phosphate cytidylyltransferase [Chitinophagaceae bacterium]